MSCPTLSAAEAAAVRAFMAAARALLGGDLLDAKLFGSRARGEGNEHSDLDVALVVADGARAQRFELYDRAFDIGLEHGVELAPLVIEAAQLQHLRDRERAIARAIDHEGVPV